MKQYNREQLGNQAKTLGFNRDTFEKTCRLAELLVFFGQHPVLSNDLAFKGGTAINLTVFRLPRLSVDTDWDFADNVPLAEMKERRQSITDTIKSYMTREGYELTARSKYTHSLDSFVYAYISAGGAHDNIKIEINYSQRSHILPLERRPIETLGIFTPVVIQTVSPIEMFAGKINALLSRDESRDLYDVYNMVRHNLFDKEQQDMLRKCTVFYSAISGECEVEAFTPDKMNAITYSHIRASLNPVINKLERFDFAEVKERVKQFLSDFLVLKDNERDFLSAFRKGDYRPELLFDGQMLERIKNHPMAAWKMAHTLRRAASQADEM
jgi:predicted nucleotidyltransferase component of viral defense system